MGVKKHLRIIIVDDHEVVRLGLRALLDRHPDFTVVDEAGTAKEAIQKVEAHRPEVVVMDIRLPGGSGIDACREITQRLPGTKVIMLTSYAEDEMLFEAIAAGAAGYVLKQIGGDDLVRAIEAVGRGEALLDPALTQRVFERVRQAQRKDEKSAFSDLTEREVRVLALLAEARRIGRSRRCCTWARARCATTSAASWASWAWPIAPRRPPTPCSTRSKHSSQNCKVIGTS